MVMIIKGDKERETETERPRGGDTRAVARSEKNGSCKQAMAVRHEYETTEMAWTLTAMTHKLIWFVTLLLYSVFLLSLFYKLTSSMLSRELGQLEVRDITTRIETVKSTGFMIKSRLYKLHHIINVYNWCSNSGIIAVHFPVILHNLHCS